MDYQGLILEKEEGIATLTLNRPEKLKAIVLALAESVAKALEEVNNDKGVRVLIVTGAGRAFCAGVNVAALEAIARMSTREFTDFTRIFSVAYRELKRPTIAAINGLVIGMGVSIAMACDVRIASEEARFSLAQVKRGIVPDCGATYFLPRLVGTAKAIELAVTGDTIDAEEAERIGLVNKVVPPGEVAKVARELADKIAKGPPITIELAKRAIYRGTSNDLEQQLEFESFAQNICFRTGDHQEGIRSFFEKRDPLFKGE